MNIYHKWASSMQWQYVICCIYKHRIAWYHELVRGESVYICQLHEKSWCWTLSKINDDVRSLFVNWTVFYIMSSVWQTLDCLLHEFFMIYTLKTLSDTQVLLSMNIGEYFVNYALWPINRWFLCILVLIML